jgi:hypothetical protein
MASESHTGTTTPRRNRTLVVSCWVLGAVALLEVVLTAVALAPRIAASIRPVNPSAAAPPPGNSASEQPRPIATTTPPDQSGPQAAPPSPIQEAVDLKDADKTSHEPTSDSAMSQDHALQILYAKLESTEEGSKILRIAIKSVSPERLDVPQVKVQVFFYDTDENGESIPSKAQVTSKWLSAPVDWHGGKPEILEVSYLPDSADPGIRFAGYVVAIYYKGDRQDCRSEPPLLMKKFEPKYFIGLDES